MVGSDSDEDPGGICDHCNKSCDTLHTFLRHVSHSKSCQSSIDKNLLDEMKKKAKVLSKRKYYRKLSKEEKERKYKEEKHWRQANAKKRYVPRSSYKTRKGFYFDKMFQQSFEIVCDEIEPKVVEIIKKFQKEVLDEKSIDKSLYFVFEEDFDNIRYDAVKSLDNENDEHILEKFEEILCKAFEKKLVEVNIEELNSWKTEVLTDLYNNFYFRTRDKAFHGTFEDFKLMIQETTNANLSSDEERIKIKCLYEQSSIKTKHLDFLRKEFHLKMKRQKLLKEYM